MAFTLILISEVITKSYYPLLKSSKLYSMDSPSLLLYFSFTHSSVLRRAFEIFFFSSLIKAFITRDLPSAYKIMVSSMHITSWLIYELQMLGRFKRDPRVPTFGSKLHLPTSDLQAIWVFQYVIFWKFAYPCSPSPSTLIFLFIAFWSTLSYTPASELRTASELLFWMQAIEPKLTSGKVGALQAVLSLCPSLYFSTYKKGAVRVIIINYKQLLNEIYIIIKMRIY